MAIAIGVPTARCAAFTGAIKARFPGAIFDGIYACRHIIPHDGGSSSEWSEHAWSNAVDFGGTAATMQKVIAFASANRARYGINNIIGPGSAVNVVHVDFLPSHLGQVPPCAGGGVTPTPPGGGGHGQVPQRPTPPKPGPKHHHPPKPNPIPPPTGVQTSGIASIPVSWLKKALCIINPAICGAEAIGGAVGGIVHGVSTTADFLSNLPRYLEAGAGGSVMVVGLAVALVGLTGQQNRVTGAVGGGLTGGPAGAAVGAATAAPPPRPDVEAVPSAGRPRKRLKAPPRQAEPATIDLRNATPAERERVRAMIQREAG